jgi:exosome complex exonuclease RRP6
MADPPPPPSPSSSLSSFNDVQAPLKSALLSTTRAASALCAEDVPFQRSLNPDFAQELDRQNGRLLALAERLLASAVAGGSEVVSTSSRVTAPSLPDGDALDRNWSGVVDVVDSLLERTDGVLDEVRGVIKKGASATMTASEVRLIYRGIEDKGLGI